ncbi:MAG: hypothetical protein ACYC66_01435 [Chloroflexota bacterium]
MRTRTLGILGAVLVAAALALGGLSTALAQSAGPNGPGWGPGGMMGGFGRGGWGMGGMMGGWYGTAPTTGKTLTIEEAKQSVEQYLAGQGNPNLAVTEVMEFERNFYAIVAERDTGKGAMELLVNKGTGAVFPEYGPNMMWNSKYGHMGGFGGMMGGFGGGMMGGWWGAAPTDQGAVTSEQAQAIAQKWLDANLPGSTTESPDAFYGYYTLHTERDGKVTGMLSVNAATGQLWYHNWHGEFVAMIGDEH